MTVDFGTLFSLIVQSKITGKGHMGNGRIYVMLMQTAADREFKDIPSELDILRRFGNSTTTPDSYQRMDKYLNRLLKRGGQYPASLFQFTQTDFLKMIPKMHRFIDKVIDNTKLSQLIYTLLELIKQDERIDKLNYGNRIISKSELFGTYARPKKICAEAFLLGIMIYTHKNTSSFTPESLLETTERTPFRLVRYTDVSSIDAAIETNIELNLCENSITERTVKTKFTTKYQIQADKEFSNGNIFLYGAGAIGKSTYLWEISEGVKLFVPLRLCIHHERNNILEYILLKYHYQMDYNDIETCMICEGRDKVISQLTELERLLSDKSENIEPKYTLLLDGWNEADTRSQIALSEEIRYIAQKCHNSRIIVSGRSVPKLDVFSDFEKVELLGIPHNEVQKIINKKQVKPDDNMLKLLELPIFMNMYTENNVSAPTRGEMLDAYLFKSDIPQNITGFLVRFTLPFIAKYMTDRNIFNISRADIYELSELSFDTFVDNERVFQNYIAPFGYNKKSLLKSRDDDIDIVDIVVNETGFFTTENGYIFSFIHQYYRDYFAVRYIINFAEAMNKAYELGYIYESENLLKKSTLDFKWFDDDDCYRLMGEICGDYKNTASEDMQYTYTLLDDILDMARYFHGSRIAENIINIMSLTRNKCICGVDFGGLALPMNISPNIRFSLDGEMPCRFTGCQVLDFGVFSSKIYGTAYSSDGKLLVLCFADGYTILWNSAEHRLMWELDLSEYTEYALEFEIAFFSNDNIIELISCRSHLKIDIDSHAVTVFSQSEGRANIPEYFDISDDKHISSINREILYEIYPHLKQFKGCNFCDAEFLDEEMEEIAQIIDIEM